MLRSGTFQSFMSLNQLNGKSGTIYFCCICSIFATHVSHLVPTCRDFAAQPSKIQWWLMALGVGVDSAMGRQKCYITWSLFSLLILFLSNFTYSETDSYLWTFLEFLWKETKHDNNLVLLCELLVCLTCIHSWLIGQSVPPRGLSRYKRKTPIGILDTNISAFTSFSSLEE